MIMNKSGDKLLAVLQVTGRQKQYEKPDESLVKMEKIKDFYYHNKLNAAIPMQRHINTQWIKKFLRVTLKKLQLNFQAQRWK
jgi:hypothetical protein